MRFVIIGGDAAGMSAASRAKRNRPDMDIIVLEKTHDVSYSACGMPYNIADKDKLIDDLVVRKADVFREKYGINLLTGHFVEKIDSLNKKVFGATDQGKSFEFSYDKLLIATGGSPIVPKLPGFDLPCVMALKNLHHGRQIKDYLKEKKVKKVVIMGIGYIGLEMCEAFHAQSIEVTMIDMSADFLPWMTKDLSDKVRKEIESNNIIIKTGCRVNEIKLTNKCLKIICDDVTLEADMVFVAIGIKPNSELAKEAGLTTGVKGSISVNKNLASSDENIYAAGDCADAYHFVTGEKTWIPLALRANRAGWAVADNICGKNIALPGVAGTSAFKIFDLEVSRTGLSEKEALNFGFIPVSVTIKAKSRAHAYPGASEILVHITADKKTGRLLGVKMVGKEGVAHRINAVAIALQAQMTIEQFCQADLVYAPPFGPVWDPLLTAANQLQKQLDD